MAGEDIRAVVFDFGNVVCLFDPKILVLRLAPFSDRSRADLAAALLHSPDLFVEYETGRISSAVFLERMSARCGLSCSAAEFIEAFNAIFTPNLPTFDLLRTLKPRYRLGLLSNTSEWHFEHGIRPVPVFPLFDTVTLSFRVGAMKPDPAIYRDALGKLALPPEACVYIDDIREYTEAASALGMRGIHYTGHEDLLGRLGGLGVRTS